MTLAFSLPFEKEAIVGLVFGIFCDCGTFGWSEQYFHLLLEFKNINRCRPFYDLSCWVMCSEYCQGFGI